MIDDRDGQRRQTKGHFLSKRKDIDIRDRQTNNNGNFKMIIIIIRIDRNKDGRWRRGSWWCFSESKHTQSEWTDESVGIILFIQPQSQSQQRQQHRHTRHTRIDKLYKRFKIDLIGFNSIDWLRITTTVTDRNDDYR